MHFHDANILHPGKLTAGSPENQPVETGKSSENWNSSIFGVPNCDFSRVYRVPTVFFRLNLSELLSIAARLSHGRKPIIL